MLAALWGCWRPYGVGYWWFYGDICWLPHRDAGCPMERKAGDPISVLVVLWEGCWDPIGFLVVLWGGMLVTP